MPRWLLAILPAMFWTSASAVTPLDEFVYAHDSAYTYSVADADGDLFHTRYTLFMTSGTWREETEVNRTSWDHWVTIYVPRVLTSHTALLVISGGSNDSQPDFDEFDNTVGPLSLFSGSVIVNLGQVPNQPLTFTGEAAGRSEDALLAYSWQQFLENPADVSWPAHLPMTRAAVRAMDAVQDHLSQVRPDDPITDFIVAGASKRGWTTWLAAAVENGPLGGGRVSAIIPMVIDVLNTERSFDHHFKVYGFWAPAIQDYVDAGCMDYLGSPEMQELFEMIDPYSYLERLSMPKFIFNSAGDQFFLPDSWKFYYKDLPGIKRIRYFPNTDHSLEPISNPLAEILRFYLTLIEDGPSAVPDCTWTTLPDGTIELQTSENDVSVKLWQATNPSARDFRLEEIGEAYTSTTLSDQGGGIYAGNVTPPEDGWTAYFVEVTFSDDTATTSGVLVTTKPETLVLRIRQAGKDVELNLNSKRGEWYRLYSGEGLTNLTLTDTLVPSSDVTTWIDPEPAPDRKFYKVERVTP